MAHLHSDMERFDFHVALELCEIVIESATLVPIVFAFSVTPVRFGPHLCRSIPIPIANRCVRLEPHTAKRVIRVVRALRAFSVVAKNQYPGLVTLTHYHDRLGIEIAEINADVLRVRAGLPQKDSRGFCARFESINEVAAEGQETIVPG